MSLLLPLGLLGLLSIAVLILIYILKPNYQQKFISSTYVWKLSLKYRKKKIPVSRLRNILLFLCQLLIFTACALILSQPVIPAESVNYAAEKVIIIDSSANMLASTDNKTRFERAVEEATQISRDTFGHGGLVSVIVAGTDGADPLVLAERWGQEKSEDLYSGLNALIYDQNGKLQLKCNYGAADIQGAMDIAAKVLNVNNDAEVILCTATTYLKENGVDVRNMAEPGEWNAAILNCTPAIEENYYVFTVDVAAYGRDQQVTVNLEINGAVATNSSQTVIRLSQTVNCTAERTQTVVFDTADSIFDEIKLRGYTNVRVYLDLVEPDSFSIDNTFYLYGGEKETIRILYYSSAPNPFIRSFLRGIRQTYQLRYNIEPEFISDGVPAVEGYDFYIYEHTMPSVMPTDGVSFLIDPDIAPEGSGLVVGEKQVMPESLTLALGVSHQITDHVDASQITITSYTPITEHDQNYQELMYFAGSPILMARNEMNAKQLVLALNLNRSNLPVLVQFPVLLMNIFNYYFPLTIEEFVFDVDQSVQLNARGPSLTVRGAGVEQQFTKFPASLTLSSPGSYTMTQTLLTGQQRTETFFVKISADQSKINRQEDELIAPVSQKQSVFKDQDLLFYFAAALIFLLFAEWLLQIRENY